MRSTALQLMAIGLSWLWIGCGGDGTSYTPCTSDDDCEAGTLCLDGECQPAPSCTEDGDCAGGRVCLEGYCAQAECNEDADCAADQPCEEHRRGDAPGCRCSPDADWPPDEYCEDECTCQPRQDVPCVQDDECADGELCIDDKCQLAPSCSQDADCPEDTVCEDGSCARPCATDEDCGNPQLVACIDGHCVDRCLRDTNCSAGQICEDNLCVPAECSSDADCDGELVRCNGGRCESYTPCETDADCGPNYECIDQICEERPQCSIDQDCWDQGLDDMICIDNHCRPVPTCDSEADCDADQDCIGGRCLAHVCRGDADCDGGRICVAGECVTPDPGDTVYEVTILNSGGPIVAGQQLQLAAIALNQAGDELPGVELSWSSDAPDRVAVDAASGLATGGAEAGTAAVTASAVAAGVDSDPLLLTNQPAVAADSLRVTVIDALDRQPVAGATVVLDDGATPQAQTTDAGGVASFAAPEAAVDIHVFSAEHNYLSVIATSAVDLLLPLPARSGNAAVGGFTGQMTFSGMGALGMGVAGTSLAGNLIDMSFAQLMGQIFQVPIPNTQYNLPLPAQLVAELSAMGQDIAIKDTYYVVGQRGLRTGWSMGGRIDDDVLWNLAGGGQDIETVLIELLPYFSLLNHGVHPVVDVFPYPLVADDDDRDNDGDTAEMRPDWDAMLDLDMAPTTPQNLALGVTTPQLPEHAGAQMRTAIYVTGAMTPLGFTPLGMSAEQDPSGLIPPLVLKMAPAYGGLEVGGYAVLVLGFPQTAQNEMATDLAAVLHVTEQLPTDVEFAGGFLGFPEDASYDAGSRTLVAGRVDGADLFRSTLMGADGGWDVYLANADTVTYTLPAPPDGMADLAAGATVTLGPIDLVAGLTYDDLLAFDGDDLDRINDLAQAFSRYRLE